MTIIVTHDNPDFDALASLIVARKIYRDAICIMPNSPERNVKEFVERTNLETILVPFSKIDLSRVEKLVLVDFKRVDRSHVVSRVLTGGMKPEIHVIDHHQPHEMDVVSDVSIVDMVGACSTLIAEIVEREGIELEPLEATLLLLGIYEDTGSFTFLSTTPRDLVAASKLIAKGADISMVSEFLKRELTPTQLEILNDMVKNVYSFKIGGVDIAITEFARDEYVPEIAVLAHKLKEILNIPVLFIIARLGDRLTVIARSDVEEVDVGRILSQFGGGGHKYAASCTLKDLTPIQVREKLLDIIAGVLTKKIRAKDIMTMPPIIVFPQATLKEAESIILKFNINALPVVDDRNGRVLGIITRQIIERALYHGLDDSKVGDYMLTNIAIVNKDTALDELEEIMLTKLQRIVPVVDDDGTLIGVVTRGELLKAIYEETYKQTYKKELGLFRKNVWNLFRERVPKRILEIIETARMVGESLGLNVYLVGGFVRDLILKVENYDLDFVVEGDEVAFAKVLAEKLSCRVNIHDKFETAVIIFPDGYRIDVSTARMEYYEAPASLPKVVRGSIKRDLYRRDFTINAMAIKITGDDAYTLFDYYGGMRDIKDRFINVIHNLSFVEDPTRAFRAVRFEQRYNFRIGPQTERLIKIAVKEGIFERLSGKRIFNELKHMLSEKNAYRMVKRMEELGILKYIHPKLKCDSEIEEVFENVREVLAWYELLFKRRQPEAWLVNMMALLFRLDLSEVDELARWFNLSSRERDILLQGISQWKKVIEKLKETKDTVENYRLLRPYAIESLLFFLAMVDEDEIRQKIGMYLMELMDIRIEVSGKDVLNFGVNPGPIVGKLLEKVLEAKVRGDVRTKEEELNLLKRLIEDLKGKGREVGLV
ncbi:MAG: CBS domain-containing protein [Thermosulfidibacteraceae bacterium]|jgi:tRNA nucleotidyltransferase (CCA-adding enzyme)